MSVTGISWAVCKSAPREITTPALHPTTQVFTGQMSFLLPNHQRQSTDGHVASCNSCLYFDSQYDYRITALGTGCAALLQCLGWPDMCLRTTLQGQGCLRPRELRAKASAFWGQLILGLWLGFGCSLIILVILQQLFSLAGTTSPYSHTYCHAYNYWYSITHSLFHSRLKSFLFCKSCLPQPFLFLIRVSLYGFPRLFTLLLSISVFLLFSFSVFKLF